MYQKKELKRILVSLGMVALFTLFAQVSVSNGEQANQEESSLSLPLELLEEHDIRLIPGLKEILNGIMDSAQKKEPAGIAAGVSKILKIKKELDTQNLFPVSDYLMLKACRMASMKDFAVALALIRGARDVSPGYGKVDFVHSSILIQKSPLNSLQAISYFFTAIQKASKNGAEWSSLVSKVLAILLLTVTLSFIFYLSLVFFVHLRPLFYDLQTFTPFTYGKVPSRIFAVVLLMLPAAIGGIKLFVLAVPVFLWSYLGSRPRAIIVSFFLFFGLVFPQAIKELAKQTAYSNSTSYRSLERVNLGNWDHDTLGHLKRESMKENPSPAGSFAMGYLYKKKREYQKAIHHYENYLKSFPNDPMGLCNLGATYFEMGQLKAAVKYFREALKRNPNLFEAHLNMNLYYAESLDTENANMEYDKAVKLDPIRTKNFMDKHSKGETRGNLDCLLPPLRVDEYLADLKSKTDLHREALWRYAFGPVSYESFLITMAGSLMLLVGFYYYKKTTGCSQICVTCGMVFIDPLQLLKSARERCFQCSAAFSRKHKVDPKKKKELQMKAAGYSDSKKKLQIALNLVFPGGGYLFAGKDYLGFVFVVLNSFFLATMGILLIKGMMAGIGAVEILTSHVYFAAALAGYYVVSTLVFFAGLKND